MLGDIIDVQVAELAETSAEDPTVAPLDPNWRAFMAEQATLEPGRRIESYEIIRELGRGGMSVVYLARDVQLGRRVAIKVLSMRLLSEATRFLNEAQATARCQHENIVVIHSVGTLETGVPYMVLEHLAGSTLKDFLKERRLPAAKAVELMVPVVRALVVAHGERIVHRDLKPSNIVLTRSGTIKVLDFGIAKTLDPLASFAEPERQLPHSIRRSGAGSDALLTTDAELSAIGQQIGTVQYMAPEQWGADEIDYRADIWAVGLILYQMVVGAPLLGGRSAEEIHEEVCDLERPFPSVSQAAPTLPREFVEIVDRCLQKKKSQRFDSAKELLQALEALLPHYRGAASDQCPYPGLAAFDSSEANRYFGRPTEIRQALLSLDRNPLLAITGPSGIGKSSFVRAGLIPALRGSGENWDSFDIRPGRRPLSRLASICQQISRTNTVTASPTTRKRDVENRDEILTRLREQPGYFANSLRRYANEVGVRIVLFVDQFEEVFTLVPDRDERMAFASSLLAMADDAGSPLRVVLSLRSDFLDRVSEHEELSQEMTRGLMLLPQMSRDALRSALTQPAEMAGYRFEDAAMVEAMLDVLETSLHSLPILQFVAGRLWELRNKESKVLPRAAYDELGGIEGALAAHADATYDSFSQREQGLVRKVFHRLVTPERTRALVDVSELEALGLSGEINRVFDRLSNSRLITVDARGGDTAVVELVHESLITGWPRLKRWLDEDAEHAVLVAELRDVARQWDSRGRPPGLLWRADALADAQKFAERYRGRLAAREQDYLDAAFALQARSVRIRRVAIAGAFVLVSSFAAATGIGFVKIRSAEQVARVAEKDAREAELVARKSEQAATDQAGLANQEAARAQEAERKVSEQLEKLKAEENARMAAEQQATKAAEELRVTNTELASSNRQLGDALARAKKSAEEAAKSTLAERALSHRLEVLLEEERQRVRELEKKRGKIIDDLH